MNQEAIAKAGWVEYGNYKEGRTWEMVPTYNSHERNIWLMLAAIAIATHKMVSIEIVEEVIWTTYHHPRPEELRYLQMTEEHKAIWKRVVAVMINQMDK